MYQHTFLGHHRNIRPSSPVPIFLHRSWVIVTYPLYRDEFVTSLRTSTPCILWSHMPWPKFSFLFLLLSFHQFPDPFQGNEYSKAIAGNFLQQGFACLDSISVGRKGAQLLCPVVSPKDEGLATTCKKPTLL